MMILNLLRGDSTNQVSSLTRGVILSDGAIASSHPRDNIHEPWPMFGERVKLAKYIAQHRICNQSTWAHLACQS
jgi:hypothetical protein